MIMISIIVSVRINSEAVGPYYSVRNHLKSLRNQTVPEKKIEIIVSDYGSDSKVSKQIRSYCRKYNSKYIYTDEKGIWNKPKALNIGIKNSSERSEYLLCTDIDMIFRNDFIETVLKIHKKVKNAFILAQFFDLDTNSLTKNTDVVNKFDYLANIGVPHCCWRRHLVSNHPECAHCTGVGYGTDCCTKLGKKYTTKYMKKPRLAAGPCQSTTRNWFFKIRGYDEKLIWWGASDTDMRYRAKRYGLNEIWIQGETTYLHQAHIKQIDIAKKNNMLKEFEEQVKKNRRRRDTLKTVTRNQNIEWGSRVP